VIGAAGKQPRSESLAFTGALPPLCDGVPPQGGGGRAEGESADPAGLGGADHLVRRGAGDGPYVAVKVTQLQGRQLTPPGTGVRGQPGQQQRLLGPMPGRVVGGTPPFPDRRVDCLLPRARQDRPHLVHRCMHPHGGMWRAAHPVQGVQVHDPFGVGPPERRPQYPHPRPHRRVRPPPRSPVGARGGQHLRGEVHRPPLPDRILRQEPRHRPLSTVAIRGRRTATPEVARRG